MKQVFSRLGYAFSALAGLAAGFPSVAEAHPGHGNPEYEQSLLHYLLEPEHAMLLIAAVLLAGVLTWVWKTKPGPSDQ